MTWRHLLVAALLAIVGCPLALGGGWLLALGGSPYFLLAGSGLLAAAILALRHQMTWATKVYALVLIGTVVWALADVGSDFWPLVSRLAAPFALGLLLLLIARGALAQKRRVDIAGLVLGAVLLAGVIGAFEPHGVIAPQNDGSREAVGGSGPIDWRTYAGDAGGRRHSGANQITQENVGQLAVAWRYSFDEPVKVDGDSQDQNTPLMVGNTLYACSARNVIHALDAETGKLRWQYDPHVAKSDFWRCRSLAYWEGSGTQACEKRIFETTVDGRLIALDAANGGVCKDFGTDGIVNLNPGMNNPDGSLYRPVSGPTVVGNRIIVGGYAPDDYSLHEGSGAIRAFDARDGTLLWAWNAGRTYTGAAARSASFAPSTPNMWSFPAFDAELGLLYVPLANAPLNYWGANRSAEVELYTTSIVALDISTGRTRWAFQTVHHDLWDYDVAPQPTLVDWPDGRGGRLPALIQATKRGQLFVLDRRSGKPLMPVEERAVPQGAVPGERLSPTQPYSASMPAVGSWRLSESDMWGATPLDQLWCRIAFRTARYDGDFTPVTAARETLIFPSGYGGINWGGVALDPERDMLVVNDIRLPLLTRLVPRDEAAKAEEGAHVDTEGGAPQIGAPYALRWRAFLSPLGIPCLRPPWGTLTGIALNTRRIIWQRPAGTVADAGPLGPTGLAIPLGMPTLGGSVTTSAGLTFFAGTQDHFLRAMSTASGAELWAGRLPVGAQATPMTYVSPRSGRQFVVIVAGGAPLSPRLGTSIVAYSLPTGSPRSRRR